MTTIKSITIKKTKKPHYCNACLWLFDSAFYSDLIGGYEKVTDKEMKAINFAKECKGIIPTGSEAYYDVGIFDGEFFTSYSFPEIHKICMKYNLYDN